MKTEHDQIINLLTNYLKEYPTVRFGQALHNLGINEFKNSTPAPHKHYELRDNYNDDDSDILERVKARAERSLS